MEQEDYEKLSKIYAPMITRLIDNNKPFYRSNAKFIWQFINGNDESIVSSYNGNTNIIYININSISSFINSHKEYNVEYFLLHEIRHAFQYEMIVDYKTEGKCAISSEIVELWNKEHNSYIPALNDKGKENKDYEAQDIEVDAYAFAYAVMKYKYGNCNDLYLPSSYEDDFCKNVNEWIRVFEDEEIKVTT